MVRGASCVPCHVDSVQKSIGKKGFKNIAGQQLTLVESPSEEGNDGYPTPLVDLVSRDELDWQDEAGSAR